MTDDHVCCGCHEEEFITDATFRLAGKDMEIAALQGRVEALTAFVKRVKRHFDRHGINNDADLRLQEAAHKLVEEK